MGQKRKRRLIGRQPARLAVKQGAERGFQFGDVARQGGLRQAEAPRRAGQGPGFGHGKERAGQSPVEMIHTDMNNMSWIMGNIHSYLARIFWDQHKGDKDEEGFGTRR